MLNGGISVGTSALVALTGYLVVFLGLTLLMLVILAMGRIMVGGRNRGAAVAPAQEPPVKTEPAAQAPGSAGEIRLYDVPDREAAMIMAIVADHMGRPLNELRFISIREVK